MISTTQENLPEQLQTLFDGLYLDVQMPGIGSQTAAQELFIQNITKAIISLATAWWSLQELFDYLKKRQQFIKEANQP